MRRTHSTSTSSTESRLPSTQRASGRRRPLATFSKSRNKWEYSWYAAWDLAFHCVPLALVDSEFAKQQLVLMTREWYMHPNGQLPAYEWAFGDVNPPVHAWAAWRVYKIDKKRRGTGRREQSGMVAIHTRDADTPRRGERRGKRFTSLPKPLVCYTQPRPPVDS
jgi:hypothetical protein